MLHEKGVKYLTLSWIRRPTDETFTLQMNDESNYFRNKYTGSLCCYTVTDLYRNTEYKFRVMLIWIFYVSYLTMEHNLFVFSWQHKTKRVKVIILKSQHIEHYLIDLIPQLNRESKDIYSRHNVVSFGVMKNSFLFIFSYGKEEKK